MRAALITLTIFSAATAFAQPYTISTFAGGAAPRLSVATLTVAVGSPPGLATDTADNPHFASDSLNCVSRLDARGVLTRVAGNAKAGYSGDGGPSASAQLGSQLNYPIGLASDDPGNLYIADGDNSRIRMVSRDGIITTVAGTGVQGYMGDGGPAAAAQLNGPSGLASDGAGNLYVADQFNNAIRLLQPVSSNIGIAGITNAASGLAGSIAGAVRASKASPLRCSGRQP